jgi:hypothetical protein
VLLSVLVGLNGWLAASFISPFPTRVPEYVIIGGPLAAFASWFVVGLAALVAVQIGLHRRVGDIAGSSATRRYAPLLLLALPPLSVAMLASPLERFAAPWVYFFVDLAPWLWLGTVVLVALNVREALGESGSSVGPAIRTDPPRWARWDAALLIAVTLASLALPMKTRFDSGIVGDEPKYLRYLELWYRGAGMDITNLVPISQLPSSFRPNVFANIKHAVSVVPTIAGDLWNDVRRRLHLSAPDAPGPAFSNGSHFVEGKRGGVYQVHMPGYSLIAFPAYYLDRSVLNWTTNPTSQFPPFLYATGAWLGLLYLGWGLAVFRLLHAHTSDVGLAWVLAFLAMTSLPVTAFSYQFYPEVTSGLFLALIARYIIYSSSSAVLPALGYGLMAGYLPWMHVRFASIAALSVCAMALSIRTRWRAVVAYTFAFAIPTGLMCLYTYHVTGSLIPSRMWTILPDLPVMNASGVPRRLLGLWFDTDWGLIPHAPVYVLALAGLTTMWARNRQAAMVVPLIILALTIPAAGHAWTGGGTTPLRLVAAVVPLLALPLADAVRRFRSSRWFMAAFVVLGLIGVQNGLTYNTNFDRATPALNGPTISGWLLRQAFPHVDVEPLTNPLVWFWVAIFVVLLLVPLRPIRHLRTNPRVSRATATTVTLIALAMLGSVVSAASGVPRRTRFMDTPDNIRAAALNYYTRHPRAPVVSTTRGWASLESFFPNGPGLEVQIARLNEPVKNQPFTLRVTAASPDTEKGWGTLLVDFGDGSRPSQRPVHGSLTITHTYAASGEYPLYVSMVLPGGRMVNHRESIRVFAHEPIAPFGLDSVPGLPVDLMTRPATITISRATIAQEYIRLSCETEMAVDAITAADHFVWLMAFENGNLRAKLYHATPTNVLATSRGSSFTLQISPAATPEPASKVSVIVNVGSKNADTSSARSAPLPFEWPTPALTTGAPIVLTQPKLKP